jgi:hypothetical protein
MPVEVTTQKGVDKGSVLLTTLQPPKASSEQDRPTPIPIYKEEDQTNNSSKSLPFGKLRGYNIVLVVQIRYIPRPFGKLRGYIVLMV